MSHLTVLFLLGGVAVGPVKWREEMWKPSSGCARELSHALPVRVLVFTPKNRVGAPPHYVLSPWSMGAGALQGKVSESPPLSHQALGARA